MKFSRRRIFFAVIAICAALALGMGVPAPAHAAPPKPKGSTPVDTKPLAQFGSAVGPDVAALATFAMNGKRYVAVGGDITGYKDKDDVTHTGSRLFILTESGDFVWGASSISGGYLHTIQPVSSDGGKLVTLYIGGDFTSVNGQNRKNVAAFQVRSVNGSLSVELDSAWVPKISGTVRNITAGDGRIYTAASAVTALNPTNGSKLWSTAFECGAIALLYANKSVYAGGFSRKAGGVKSKGAFKLNPKTGKVDKKFKPSIPANKKNCSSGKNGYSGSIPLDFAWDAANKRLVECDGGIKNYVRSLNPKTGKQHWAHRMDGDAQTCTIVAKKYLFVGFHRSSVNVGRYKYNYGDMGMMIDAKSGKQKVWQPKPDFSGGGANNDGRNNGIIASVEVGNKLIVGGAFQGVADSGRKKLAAFAVKP